MCCCLVKVSVDLLEYDIISSSFSATGPVPTEINNQVESPTIAAGSDSGNLLLYAFDIGADSGNDYLVTVDPDSGEVSGNPEED